MRTFDIDVARRRYTVRLAGVITLGDLKASLRAQIEAGAWTWDTVIDATQAFGVETVDGEIARVTTAIRAAVPADLLSQRGPVVLLAPGTPSPIHDLATAYQFTTMSTFAWRVDVVHRPEDIDPVLRLRRDGTPLDLPEEGA